MLMESVFVKKELMMMGHHFAKIAIKIVKLAEVHTNMIVQNVTQH